VGGGIGARDYDDIVALGIGVVGGQGGGRGLGDIGLERVVLLAGRIGIRAAVGDALLLDHDGGLGDGHLGRYVAEAGALRNSRWGQMAGPADGTWTT